MNVPKDVKALLAITGYLTALEHMLNIDEHPTGKFNATGEALPVIASRLSAISQEIESFICATT